MIKSVFYAENDHSKFVQEQIGEELEAAIDWRELALPARHSKLFIAFIFRLQDCKISAGKIGK